jgi:hypothetical protein
LHRVLPGSGPADGNSARIGRSAATVSQRRRTALAIVRAPGPGRTCASPAGGAAPSPRPTLPRTLAEATSWAAKRQHTSVGCPSSPGADHCHQARPTPPLRPRRRRRPKTPLVSIEPVTASRAPSTAAGLRDRDDGPQHGLARNARPVGTLTTTAALRRATEGGRRSDWIEHQNAMTPEALIGLLSEALDTASDG